MSGTFTGYANYHFTVNDEGGISNIRFFRKFDLKFSKIVFFRQ